MCCEVTANAVPAIMNGGEACSIVSIIASKMSHTTVLI
eukprot:SAG25_NODE_10172_length_344_cov_0.510204_1_plen_37_part_10